METKRIDARGLRCPQPVLKLSLALPEIADGSVVEIIGDCSTFETDVRTWCDKRKKTVLSVQPFEEASLIQIQF
jgi:tRNA 2-thiouridine synthesizing protein A